MSILAPTPTRVRSLSGHDEHRVYKRATDFVVAHDYLTQQGGAERVALALAQGLEAREIVTSVYDPEKTFGGFGDFTVRASDRPLMQHFRNDVRRALPFLAGTWARMAPVDADVVVCSSSGWAHSVPTTARTTKIVYCHNPARWLYQPADYLMGMGMAARTALKMLAPGLRRWDRRAAASADLYVANSTGVARRIADIYGIDAEVIHPPVTIDPLAAQEPVQGVEPGFFLTIARARGYKMSGTLVDAFARMPEHRLVVVGDSPREVLPPNVTALGRVSDAQLRRLYAQARALVSVSREDFGLTPIEANAFGTPALLLHAGGFLDSTAEGVSGSFIRDDSVQAVCAAVQDFRQVWDEDAIRRHAAMFAPAEFVRRLTDLADRVRVPQTVGVTRRARARVQVRQAA